MLRSPLMPFLSTLIGTAGGVLAPCGIMVLMLGSSHSPTPDN